MKSICDSNNSTTLYAVLCGRWESYPREFAKCRRCRKAKYCGKECQSTAWSEGHRFWCSAKDGEEEVPEHASGDQASTTSDVPGIETIANESLITQGDDTGAAVEGIGGPVWMERDQDRPIVRERTLATLATGAEQTQAARAAASSGFRNIFSHSRGSSYVATTSNNTSVPSGSGSGGQSTDQGSSGQRTGARAGPATHRRGLGGDGAGPAGGYSLFTHLSRPGGAQAEAGIRRPAQNVVPDGPFDVVYGRARLRLQELEMNRTNFGAGMADRDDEGYGPSQNLGDHDMMLE